MDHSEALPRSGFSPGNCQLALLGDLHGDSRALVQLDRVLAPGVAILQVGDFGWYPSLADQWKAIGASMQRSVYWIRGNHEHYPSMPWLDARHPVDLMVTHVPPQHVITASSSPMAKLQFTISLEAVVPAPSVCSTATLAAWSSAQ